MKPPKPDNEPTTTDALPKAGPSNGIVSQRLYIATQLAAGDMTAKGGWSNGAVDADIKDRVKLLYRIADALIAGESCCCQSIRSLRSREAQSKVNP